MARLDDCRASCSRPERARARASACAIECSAPRLPLARATTRSIWSLSPFKTAMLYRITRRIGILQLAFGGSLKHTLGFFETVQEKIAGRKIAVPEEQSRDRSAIVFLGCLDRSFESAGPLGGKAAQ